MAGGEIDRGRLGETLMKPQWRSIGLAYVRDGSVHLWTADFGDR
jgi:hypothetical protein